jgi:hypothetical protein
MSFERIHRGDFKNVSSFEIAQAMEENPSFFTMDFVSFCLQRRHNPAGFNLPDRAFGDEIG